MNIYVANVSFKATDEDLKSLFEEYGDVSSARIVMDKYTNRSRGFAFVEMDDAGDGQKAIDGTNGKDFLGRELVVNEARPREERPERSGSSDRSGGGGYRENRGSGGGGGGDRRGGDSGGYSKRW